MSDLEQRAQRIIQAATAASSLTPEQVAMLPMPDRFAVQDQVWQVKEESPVPGLVVFSVCEGSQRDPTESHVPGDVRVFCIPAVDNAALPYCRITMSRHQPTGLRTVFPNLDAFAKEIGAEWLELATALGLLDDGDDEDEGEECEHCGFVTQVADADEDEESEDDADAQPKFCGQCGKPFEPEQPIGQH